MSIREAFFGKSQRPLGALFVLLIPLAVMPFLDSDDNWLVQGEGLPEPPPVSQAGNSLDDLAAVGTGIPRWTWQQTLRAANYHHGCLERLVLVGSTGEKGSGTKEQLKLAEQFFSKWFPVKVYGAPQTRDGEYDTNWQAGFDDLSKLTNLLRDILRELRRDPAGFADRDIVIDCTSGTKIASIAAAMVTLDRPELMFQYVGTGDGADQVIGFDVGSEYFGS